MALNTLRERLEAAIDAREGELERAELDRRLTEERWTSPCPATERRSRAPAPRSPRFAGRSRTSSSGSATGHRRSRGRDDPLQLRPARVPRGASVTLTPRRSSSTTRRLLRTETSPSQIHVMESKKPPDLHGLARPRVSTREIPTRPTRRSSTSSKGSPSTKASRSATSGDPRCSEGALRRGPSHAVPDELLPVHGAFGRGGVSCPSATVRLPTCRYSGWIEVGGAGMVDPEVFEFVGLDPSATRGSPSAGASSASQSSGTGSRRSARALARTTRVSEAVLMRVPLSWLRDYVAVDMPRRRDARRLDDLRRPWLPRSRRRRLRRRRQPRALPRRSVLEAAKHPNADRLRSASVDVGEGEPYQIICGAWNFEAGRNGRRRPSRRVLPIPGGPARRAQAARRGSREG